MRDEKLKTRAIAGESDRVQRRRARLTPRVRVAPLVEQHPHDLDVRRACVRGHGGVEGREPPVARGRPRIGARPEQIAHDLASFEEGCETEGGVAVGRDAVRLCGIRSHELADAG